MKIAFFSTKTYDREYFEKYNSKYEMDYLFLETPLNKDTASLAKDCEVVCIFVNDVADEATIEELASHNVKLIALRCAGFNNVNIDYATKKGMKVVRVPAYSPEAVADHAMALILTLNRKTHKAYNRVREGNFALQNMVGFNLKNKTVGVIGTGQIGATFAKVIQGFGCKIVAYDISKNESLTKIGVSYLSLEKLYESSDIISLHCPLNDTTKHIINAESIAQMKKGVMIINTSRGALIDTVEVIEGLKKKKIGYLGIDVYEQEENLFFEDKTEQIIEDELILQLMSFPNVLITSHQAFFTQEALDEITTTTLDNIKAFKDKQELVNQITN